MHPPMSQIHGMGSTVAEPNLQKCDVGFMPLSASEGSDLEFLASGCWS
jgi:hypothetical protein